jgi:hypothetical protein
MNNSIEITFSHKPLFGFIISGILHLVIILIFIFSYEFAAFDTSRGSGYLEVFSQSYSGDQFSNYTAADTRETELNKTNLIPNIEDASLNNKSDKKITPSNSLTEGINSNSKNSIGGSSGLGGLFGNADTSNLKGYYSETTLNVRIKFPEGWTYIDQNVKKKLDGVTFWGLSIGNHPAPYIHLEVKDKYYFKASNYKYISEEKNYTIYFNDPVEMEGQFSQIIYIRTETEEDYSLKLIIQGRDAFYQYQPIFLGMIKTFRFGSSLFKW